MVIEEMTGGQHQVDERKRAEQLRVNGRKLQEQTQFVRRPRSVFDSSNESSLGREFDSLRRHHFSALFCPLLCHRVE
jgi:hypothetical protein